HTDLHSFPTRRSSDLGCSAVGQKIAPNFIMAGPSLLGGIIEQRLGGDFALGLSARLGHRNLAKAGAHTVVAAGNMCGDAGRIVEDRKSTRLNSSHQII